MTWVTGHNGVRLHVQTAGDPANPAILLIHGWSQHSLCWQHQMSALADRFYLVVPDLRGHGASDKPTEAEAYDNSTPWAGDIAAIIDQMGLDKPLLAGWSLGGYICGDYLRVHGSAAVSGLALVGSAITLGKHAPPEVIAQRSEDAIAKGMYSEDQAENLAATLAFVKACTADPISADDLAMMVGYNMLVSPGIRQHCRLRHEDYRPMMAALDLPVMVLWGSKDAIVLPPMAQQSLDTIPNAQAVELSGLGHAPFFEDPTRFNAALTAFADQAFTTHQTQLRQVP